MGTKERDRLKVLHEVRRRHITQKQAAMELGLSARWVRKLLVRLRREGGKAVTHAAGGKSERHRSTLR
jgi:DNA-binding Lrp family transcriptional regulator